MFRFGLSEVGLTWFFSLVSFSLLSNTRVVLKNNSLHFYSFRKKDRETLNLTLWALLPLLVISFSLVRPSSFCFQLIFFFQFSLKFFYSWIFSFLSFWPSWQIFCSHDSLHLLFLYSWSFVFLSFWFLWYIHILPTWFSPSQKCFSLLEPYRRPGVLLLNSVLVTWLNALRHSKFSAASCWA